MLRSSRYIVRALVACSLLLTGSILAQVEVRPAALSSEILLQLFGVVNSAEFEGTAQVRSLYIAALYQGEVVLNHSVSVEEEGVTFIASGVLDVLLQGCSDGITLFSGSEERGDSGRGTALSTRCLVISGYVGGTQSIAAGDQAIFIGNTPTDIPINQWEPFLIYAPLLQDVDPVTRQTTPDDVILFLLYLSDAPLPDNPEQYPQVPRLESWDDLP